MPEYTCVIEDRWAMGAPISYCVTHNRDASNPQVCREGIVERHFETGLWGHIPCPDAVLVERGTIRVGDTVISSHSGKRKVAQVSNPGVTTYLTLSGITSGPEAYPSDSLIPKIVVEPDPMVDWRNRVKAARDDLDKQVDERRKADLKVTEAQEALMAILDERPI